ncbi:SDR family oxidoreductase [Herbaspirillum sp. DW155]|uniref:SDR family oxidoreductase n=1 Tax=Herbaspirillum sp. DW155 TaxID=3095609 RepID=UPI00308FB747|nr:SDR family oxidoreductase [Herbaspirillum sp. DW155]
MNILVIGATGLIGSYTMAALQRAGHHAIGVSRSKPSGTLVACKELDIASLTDAQAWLPHLEGIDAVINCVGIIRESRPGDFQRLHHQMPIALFAACEQAGVARVVQVSALGSEPHAVTAYWRSKGTADADLLQRRLAGTVVRPSLVYGDEGASSRVFTMMASLPLIIMPMAHRALVQPIHVENLADVLVTLLTSDGPVPRELAAVGPRALSIAAYIETLRAAMAWPPGLVLTLPAAPARLLARCAELLPGSALTVDSLRMLEQSADGSNTADSGPVRAILGRPLRRPEDFTGPAQRARAVCAWALPACRLVIALLWILTAYASWFGWPHTQSLDWLAQCGLPHAWAEPALLGASLLDATIGVIVLVARRSWIWPLQMTLVLGYTAIMSFCLPQFWMHPFGPLSKNLPLLALMFIMWRLTANSEKQD